MDQKLVDQGISFHGPMLVDQLASKKVNVKLPNFLSYSTGTKHTDSPVDHHFQNRICKFVASKAGVLFKKLEKPPEVVVNSEDNDQYAVLPPLEAFLDLPADVRRKHFYECLCRGDVVIGLVSSVQDTGLIVTLLCMDQGKARDIDQLRITAFCPFHEIPKHFAHGDLMGHFDLKDKVRGVVLKFSAEKEQIVISFQKRALPKHLIQSDLPLGLINDEELPLHYRQLQDVGSQSYNRHLESMVNFSNPSNVGTLSSLMGLNKPQLSLTDNMLNMEYKDADYAEKLRKTQSYRWALKSVAEGISHFKQGKQVEAMQYLNKALQIDKENVEALVARGALYANNESYLKAIDDFDEALKQNPGHTNARKYMCETLVAQGRRLIEQDTVDEATDYLMRALKMHPGLTEAQILLERIENIKLTKEPESKAKDDKQPVKRRNSSNSAPDANLMKTKDKLEKIIKEDTKRKHRKSDSSSSSSGSSSSSSSSSDSSSSSSSSDSESTPVRTKAKPSLKLLLKNSVKTAAALQNSTAQAPEKENASTNLLMKAWELERRMIETRTDSSESPAEESPSPPSRDLSRGDGQDVSRSEKALGHRDFHSSGDGKSGMARQPARYDNKDNRDRSSSREDESASNNLRSRLGRRPSRSPDRQRSRPVVKRRSPRRDVRSPRRSRSRSRIIRNPRSRSRSRSPQLSRSRNDGRSYPERGQMSRSPKAPKFTPTPRSLDRGRNIMPIRDESSSPEERRKPRFHNPTNDPSLASSLNLIDNYDCKWTRSDNDGEDSDMDEQRTVLTNIAGRMALIPYGKSAPDSRMDRGSPDGRPDRDYREKRDSREERDPRRDRDPGQDEDSRRELDSRVQESTALQSSVYLEEPSTRRITLQPMNNNNRPQDRSRDDRDLNRSRDRDRVHNRSLESESWHDRQQRSSMERAHRRESPGSQGRRSRERDSRMGSDRRQHSMDRHRNLPDIVKDTKGRAVNRSKSREKKKTIKHDSAKKTTKRHSIRSSSEEGKPRKKKVKSTKKKKKVSSSSSSSSSSDSSSEEERKKKKKKKQTRKSELKSASANLNKSWSQPRKPVKPQDKAERRKSMNIPVIAPAIPKKTAVDDGKLLKMEQFLQLLKQKKKQQADAAAKPTKL